MIGLPETGPNEHLLPERVYITPSRLNPWRDARQPDQRYTGTQLRRLRDLGIDPNAVADVIVRDRVCPVREMYIYGNVAHHYLLPCPIIEGRGDQLIVLSPDGSRKIVQPDGTKGRKRRPRVRRG